MSLAMLRQRIADAEAYPVAFCALMLERGCTHIAELRRQRLRHPPYAVSVEPSQQVLRQLATYRPSNRWYYLGSVGNHRFWFEDEEDYILFMLSFNLKDEIRTPVPKYVDPDCHYWPDEEEAFDDI